MLAAGFSCLQAICLHVAKPSAEFCELATCLSAGKGDSA